MEEQQIELQELEQAIMRMRGHAHLMQARYKDLQKENAATRTLSACLMCEEDLLKEYIREARDLCDQFDQEYKSLQGANENNEALSCEPGGAH
jgi:phage shock protein A